MAALNRELIRLYIGDTGTPPAISDENLDLIIAKIGDDETNFNAVVAEGWTVKAATIADWYDVSIDGRVLNRQQVFAHCQKMAAQYGSIAGNSFSSFRLIRDSDPTEEAEFSG